MLKSELIIRLHVALDNFTRFSYFLFCSSALIYPLRQVVHKLQGIRVTRRPVRELGPGPQTSESLGRMGSGIHISREFPGDTAAAALGPHAAELSGVIEQADLEF